MEARNNGGGGGGGDDGGEGGEGGETLNEIEHLLIVAWRLLPQHVQQRLLEELERSSVQSKRSDIMS